LSQRPALRLGTLHEKPGSMSLVEVGRLGERYPPSPVNELFDL
jgi:hypothetical protein